VAEQTTLAEYERETVDLEDVPADHLDVGDALDRLDAALLDEETRGDLGMDAEVFDRLDPADRLHAVALRLELLSTTVQRDAAEDDPPTDPAFQ
jgi:hypothetical protein